MKPNIDQDLTEQANDESSNSTNIETEVETESEYILKQYLLLVWRIYRRIKIKKPKLLTEIFKRRKV